MTILEIMIVVTIISILAGIAAYAVSGIREKMWQEEAKQELERIAVAIEQLAFDTGQWPGHAPRNATAAMVGSALKEIMDLTTPLAGLVDADVTFSNRGWRGPYMDQIPLDPWNRKYFFDPDYLAPGESKYKAVVGSFGPHQGGSSSTGVNDWEPDNIYVEIVPKLR
jgi:type II secretory pathway pseudopilin PulG